jgi:hypothetical protein
VRTESREFSSPSLTSHGKRRWIIEVFITDVVVASKINAAFNPTTLFAPMVERQGSTQTMETYSHMLPGVGDVAATALEEPLADLLLPYCCQDPSSMIVGSSLFIGFAGKKRADERTQTADLLITSDNSRVAGVCRGLQMPHIYAAFSAPGC